MWQHGRNAKRKDVKAFLLVFRVPHIAISCLEVLIVHKMFSQPKYYL